MKKTETYNVQVWIGLREHYTDNSFNLDDVRNIVDGYIMKNSDCVTITPTEYRYKDGYESGAIVGWINYPRFPRSKQEINRRAFMLANELMEQLGQYRVSIVTPEETYLLENND